MLYTLLSTWFAKTLDRTCALQMLAMLNSAVPQMLYCFWLVGLLVRLRSSKGIR